MGLQEWPGIIPFDQAVPGSRVTPKKGEPCDGAGSPAWPFSGHSAQWLSSPGTAQNTRRGFEHQREGAPIPARGTRRGPRSRREPGENATLRTRNPKTKRPRVPSAPGSPPPAARAHAPLGPALEGGGRLPVPGGRRADTRSAAAQFPVPCLTRAETALSSGQHPARQGMIYSPPRPGKAGRARGRGLRFKGLPLGAASLPAPRAPRSQPQAPSRRQVLGTGASSCLSGPGSFYESLAGRFLLAKSLSRLIPIREERGWQTELGGKRALSRSASQSAGGLSGTGDRSKARGSSLGPLDPASHADPPHPSASGLGPGRWPGVRPTPGAASSSSPRR